MTDSKSSTETSVPEDYTNKISTSDLVEKLTQVDDCVRDLRKEIALLRTNSFTLNHVIETVETTIRKYQGRY